jgi:hypothetical protein
MMKKKKIAKKLVLNKDTLSRLTYKYNVWN